MSCDCHFINWTPNLQKESTTLASDSETNTIVLQNGEEDVCRSNRAIAMSMGNDIEKVWAEGHCEIESFPDFKEQ